MIPYKDLYHSGKHRYTHDELQHSLAECGFRIVGEGYRALLDGPEALLSFHPLIIGAVSRAFSLTVPGLTWTGFHPLIIGAVSRAGHVGCAEVRGIGFHPLIIGAVSRAPVLSVYVDGTIDVSIP